MNREDIIHMVREAGLANPHEVVHAYCELKLTDHLERFAALVAKHEREACAKVADEQAQDEPYGHAKFRCGNIASAIRARGEQ
jgi:hypothetical protein